MEKSGGGSVQNGLSEKGSINTDNKANGMDTIGKDQKPQATPEQSVTSKGKKMKIC